jgi:para-nitrobenzyl esterase
MPRMRSRLGVVLALLTLTACGGRREVRTPDPAARRTTPSGEVVGFVGRYDSYVWMGLPYAAPPTGDRRWRVPDPPASWQGVREALWPGAPCVQYASPFGGVETAPVDTPVGDEDCLYANVYAPRTATPTSFLPVMVWIHGGGNTVGTGERYDGGNLAATQNVVVVTLNYRLGPFGWFRHGALRVDAASDAERSGNFTLLDLVRALEWVESHIAGFGGDPAKVTIFGESAGGSNTLALLLSPSAVGLFHRAIIQSGGLRMADPVAAEAFSDGPPAFDAAHSSNEVVARLLVADHTARDRADAKTKIGAMAKPDLAARLRAKSAREILAAYTPLPGSGLIPMPILFRDDAVLPTGAYLDHFRHEHEWNRVPVLIGTNRDEIKIFMFGSPDWVRRWFGLLPRFVDEAHYDVVAEPLSRMWKATGADEVAAAMVESGARDVFMYRFDWDEEPRILGTDLSRMLGASHGFEIPFVFGHFDLGRDGSRLFDRTNEPGRRELAAAMMSYWASFARTGDPGKGDGGRPEWPRWSTAQEYLVLDTPAGGGITRAAGVSTRDTVLQSIEQDQRLADPRTRCLVYHDLVFRPPVLTRRAYDEKCSKFPFEKYPWRD